MKHNKNSNHLKGAEIHTNKLTEEDVLAMRKSFRNGKLVKDIAKEFGMSISQTYRIVHGYCWQYLGGTE